MRPIDKWSIGKERLTSIFGLRVGEVGRIAVSVWIAALLLGCSDDSSTPTEPVVANPTSKAVITFVNPGALGAQEETIRNLIVDTVNRADGALNFGQLMFTVSVDPGRTIPGWGMGGYTLGPSEIEIVIDPAGAPDNVLQARLPRIVAHEIHHTVRWRSPGPYGTLLDAFVFEGMADHFAVDLLGLAPAPWSQAISLAEVERQLSQARLQFDNAGFDFGEWFLGTRDRPVWTGYTVGYEMIGAYLANHPDRSAADLVNEPTATFRPTP